MIVIQHNGRFLPFSNPVQTFIAWRADEVKVVLEEVEAAVNTRNRTAAGFLAYEAAAAFGLDVHPPMEGLPLIWFGLYDNPKSAEMPESHSDSRDAEGKEGEEATEGIEWEASVSPPAYAEIISRIKGQIVAGNTYQVNYTFPLHADFEGDGQGLFSRLTQNQAANYSAYLEIDRYAIASASPELFFALDGENLTSKPMKGTAVRGRTLAEDNTKANWLSQSVKNRAENVMIADMIRNDMGRIATTGSVKTPHLFEIERYPTLLQMTSTVTAKTNASVADIIAAMFPCASITGAPKKQTMGLIKELEPSPRGIYTGAIGFISPNRQAQFNVAIRTVLLDRQEKRATYGVGGGIVWDSTAADEYEECKVKANVLKDKQPAFSLLESLLWEPDEGYLLLDYHLERLQDSARYFDYKMQELALPGSEIRKRLEDAALHFKKPSKVRLLLAQDGAINITHSPITPLSDPARIVFAKKPVSRDNIWLYHKTTHRSVFDDARNPDHDETILWNEEGDVTEGTNANIVVEIENELFTPPIESGLLAGTFRRHLLTTGKLKERVITRQILRESGTIYLINSVRRWRRAILVE